VSSHGCKVASNGWSLLQEEELIADAKFLHGFSTVFFFEILAWAQDYDVHSKAWGHRARNMCEFTFICNEKLSDIMANRKTKPESKPCLDRAKQLEQKKASLGGATAAGFLSGGTGTISDDTATAGSSSNHTQRQQLCDFTADRFEKREASSWSLSTKGFSNMLIAGDTTLMFYLCVCWRETMRYCSSKLVSERSVAR
jgi:hypothetical protein